jgi:hypothetical protein
MTERKNTAPPQPGPSAQGHVGGEQPKNLEKFLRELHWASEGSYRSVTTKLDQDEARELVALLHASPPPHVGAVGAGWLSERVASAQAEMAKLPPERQELLRQSDAYKGWKLSVKIEQRDDGGVLVRSDDLPGLILSGEDPRQVGACIIPAIEALKGYKADSAPTPPDTGPSREQIEHIKRSLQMCADDPTRQIRLGSEYASYLLALLPDVKERGDGD